MSTFILNFYVTYYESFFTIDKVFQNLEIKIAVEKYFNTCAKGKKFVKIVEYHYSDCQQISVSLPLCLFFFKKSVENFFVFSHKKVSLLFWFLDKPLTLREQTIISLFIISLVIISQTVISLALSFVTHKKKSGTLHTSWKIL